MTSKSRKQENLRQSIGYSALGSLGSQAVSLFSFLILARMLSPHEFGLMTIVMIFTAFASIFIDMGMGSALIHNQASSERHFSTAFWFNFFVALVLSLGLVLAAGWVSGFFGSPDLKSLFMVGAFLLPVTALSLVPLAILQKEQSFKKIAYIEILAALFNVMAALTLAHHGLGVWALMAGLYASVISRVAILWYVVGWRPKLIFCRKSFKDLWGYSQYLLGTSLINYLLTKLDGILVARFVGPSSLGAYNYACQLAYLPANIVGQVFSRVFFAQYSTYKDDLSKIKTIHFKTVRMLASLTFPILLVFSGMSDVFVLAILGPEWKEMGHILSFLCIVFLLDSIGGMNSPLFLSQGRTKSLFRLTLYVRSSLILAMIIGIQFGIDGMMISLLIAKLVNYYPVYREVGKTIGFSVAEFTNNIIPPLLMSVFVAGAVIVAKAFLESAFPELIVLVILSLGAVAIYLVLILSFQKSLMVELYSILMRRHA